YVDHLSLELDIKILWKTFLNVIQREGIGEGEVQDELVDDLGFGEKLRRLKEE
ncbi:MAG: sugar transferase, partial [Prevotella pallens]|nr:sugar transferase [Prevotella pallens]